jgi:hypothetical protein
MPLRPWPAERSIEERDDVEFEGGCRGVRVPSQRVFDDAVRLASTDDGDGPSIAVHNPVVGDASAEVQGAFGDAVALRPRAA